MRVNGRQVSKIRLVMRLSKNVSVRGTNYYSSAVDLVTEKLSGL